MTDYGHDLLFGSFITPTNAAPERVVALAQASEQAGLDLVTFQDHPYQAGFLDTWTLLSYVAAQTEHIHVSANVLNLPLRPPAVLARAAASLDLLGFWDAIEAMGGRRLTPGQGVDALSEAIDIIRGTWDVRDRSYFRVDGTYYQVDGAKRGPAPAHDIGIWLGAYKPRMLHLTGRKADGWLPSLPYMKSLQDLADGNARIDEGAIEAGREPRVHVEPERAAAHRPAGAVGRAARRAHARVRVQRLHRDGGRPHDALAPRPGGCPAPAGARGGRARPRVHVSEPVRRPDR
jgi:alkanesulfonate monooxygenase SsuD/methylene tetrahydromethanopterin reductase-like flavin-dependent oxidoreductase (luciferase family)